MGWGWGQKKMVYKTNDTNDWAKSTVSKKCLYKEKEIYLLKILL